jgi:hypothetical protein
MPILKKKIIYLKKKWVKDSLALGAMILRALLWSDGWSARNYAKRLCVWTATSHVPQLHCAIYSTSLLTLPHYPLVSVTSTLATLGPEFNAAKVLSFLRASDFPCHRMRIELYGRQRSEIPDLHCTAQGHSATHGTFSPNLNSLN